MAVLESISARQLEQALSREYRQYLTGHLQRPQPHLQHIEDDIEVGISHYREFTADKPHIHPVATEHGYVLEGSLRLLLLDGSHREVQFDAGDFFVLQPGVGYATKNAPGTKILFIKSPGVNDKQELAPTEEVTAWLSAWDV
jgi:uncharacterized cupin superfamily protein